jgi:hypothetical protein
LPGQIASLLSGGMIQPLYHQVIANHNVSERIAYLFFGDIDPQACTPWVTTEQNAGVDIGARVRTSVNRFGLTGFTDA